jgi:hypothetical protein
MCVVHSVCRRCCVYYWHVLVAKLLLLTDVVVVITCAALKVTHSLTHSLDQRRADGRSVYCVDTLDRDKETGDRTGTGTGTGREGSNGKYTFGVAHTYTCTNMHPRAQGGFFPTSR